MADAARGKERIKLRTIKHDQEIGGCNTGHNKINLVIWEVKPFEDMVDEVPLKSVKSFFKIDFEGHETLLALGNGCGVDNFLS